MGLFGNVLGLAVRIVAAPIEIIENVGAAAFDERSSGQVSEPLKELAKAVEEADE